MSDLCQGCWLAQKDNTDENCVLRYNSFEYMKICPCQQCLVKGMCTNGCKEYLELTEKVDKEQRAFYGIK